MTMNTTCSILAALALATLPILPCAGAIGGMDGEKSTIAGENLQTICQTYCGGGDYLPKEVLLDEDAKYTILWNYPPMFHSIMCRLQHFCEPSFIPYDFYHSNYTNVFFSGCASPADRSVAASSKVPFLSVRNKAVSQLVPFFESGNTTNLGILTIGPLMHAYGGSPLCVWPASNVVDVTGGHTTLVSVPGATALKAGVGRGGCFDVAGWLSCTNAANRPQGFGTGKHPMADLGTYLYDTLDPHFTINWADKGIPTSTNGTYRASYFLTNSPAYLSAEAVPTNTPNPVLTIEPWRRSWEALGGLACITWRLNANPFSYTARDEWHIGTVSASSSNAVVNVITAYMEDGHPLIGNTEFFPSGGGGVNRRDRYSPPRYWDGVFTRPNYGDHTSPFYDCDPKCVFQIGYLRGESPLDGIDITYTWSISNSTVRTVDAPVSNRAMSAEIKLDASSIKRWRFRKVVDVNDGWESDRWMEDRDFGRGVFEYSTWTNCVSTNAYHWVLAEEMSPETRVEYDSRTNYMRSAVSATYPTPAALNHSWLGIPASPWGQESIARASTVCRYEDNNMAGTNVYFMGNVSYAFLDQIFLNAAGYQYWTRPDMFSESVYTFPRTPEFKHVSDGAAWFNSEWQGDGCEYTITTSGPPQPYASTNCWTNIVHVAEYSTTNEMGEVTGWINLVITDLDGRVVRDDLSQFPPDVQPEDEGQQGDARDPYTPMDEGWAISKIKFSVHNWLDIYYKVWWEPVRAWGIYSEVSSTPDWPTN